LRRDIPRKGEENGYERREGGYEKVRSFGTLTRMSADNPFVGSTPLEEGV
jgi:hypothetical protein